MNKLGTIELNNDILKKANIGLWAFELDEGSEPRMYVDEAMLGLIGLKEQIDPESTYHAWYDNIDPAHYDEVAAAVEKMTAGTHAEVQYPWHNPNGETWIVRCGGVRNFAYEKGIRIEGTHQNVTDIAHYQKKSIGDMLVALSDNFLDIYFLDPYTGVFEAYSESNAFDGQDDRDFSQVDFYEDVADKSGNIVHPDDKVLIDRMYSRDNLIGIVESGEGQEFIVRWPVGTGDECIYMKNKLIVFTDTDGGRKLIIGVQDVTKETLAEKSIRENTAIVEAMASEYECLLHVDLDTLEEEHYRTSDTIQSIVPGWDEENNYLRRAHMFAEHFVIPEDREQFLSAIDPTVVSEKVRDGKHYIVYYRAKVDDDILWYQTTFVHNKTHGDDNCALLGISNHDDAMHKSMEERAMLEALGEDFDYISYIKTDNEEETIWRFDEKFADLIPGWNEITTYSERVKLIADLFVHPDDKEHFLKESSLDAVMERLHKEHIVYINFREVFGETTIYYQGKYVLVDVAGSEGIIVGYRSVDEEARREIMYRESLEEAVRKADEANQAKSSFLFNMSHDIRTPMNAIIGFNAMAKRSVDNREKLLDCLDKVESSSKHLLSLINDVLDMSRIESGKVDVEYSPVCITDVANDLVEMVRETALKNLTIETDFSDIKHDYVLADVLHTNRILTNIISNSVKYTPEGGRVSYTIREKEACCEGYNSYEFVVEDTGIGMSKEFLERIFDEFERENSSTNSGIQGTGLGMSITKRLIDMLGGTINIESEPGKGTTVTVGLDFRAISADQMPKDTCVVTEISGLKGKKVLLVEDNELNREIATDILEEYGMIVDTAENGEIAVEKCRNAIASGIDQYHDIILMDIQMPIMDGYEATRVIRSLSRGGERRVPIVAMTANAFAEDRRKALDCGMNDHIAKPIDRSELERVLTTFVK